MLKTIPEVIAQAKKRTRRPRTRTNRTRMQAVVNEHVGIGCMRAECQIDRSGRRFRAIVGFCMPDGRSSLPVTQPDRSARFTCKVRMKQGEP